MPATIRLEKLSPAPCATWEQIRTSRVPVTCDVRQNDRNEETVPEVFTIEELGRYLKIGRNGAYNLIHAGKIHFIRIGRQIRIPRQAVDAFLMGQSN